MCLGEEIRVLWTGRQHLRDSPARVASRGNLVLLPIKPKLHFSFDGNGAAEGRALHPPPSLLGDPPPGAGAALGQAGELKRQPLPSWCLYSVFQQFSKENASRSGFRAMP